MKLTTKTIDGLAKILNGIDEGDIYWKRWDCRSDLSINGVERTISLEGIILPLSKAILNPVVQKPVGTLSNVEKQEESIDPSQYLEIIGQQRATITALRAELNTLNKIIGK